MTALQLPMIFGPGARNSDPATSHEAALKTPNLRAHDRRIVLMAHYQHRDGLTDFELGDLVGRQQTSAGKRRGELRDLGFIKDSGSRRNAPSGSRAIVWDHDDAKMTRSVLTGDHPPRRCLCPTTRKPNDSGR